MDGEKRKESKKILEEPFIFDLGEIPEVELMDYDNEKAQIVMYRANKSFSRIEKTFGDFLDVPIRFLRNTGIFS